MKEFFKATKMINRILVSVWVTVISNCPILLAAQIPPEEILPGMAGATLLFLFPAVFIELFTNETMTGVKKSPDRADQPAASLPPKTTPVAPFPQRTIPTAPPAVCAPAKEVLDDYNESEEWDEDEIEDPTDVATIDGMEGHEFEAFCAQLLQQNGFASVSVTKGSGDQGVDVLAVKDSIRYAIQCKNYMSPLGNKPVQEVAAGKTFYKCHVGVVMTNSTFTPGAKELAQAVGVLLWDREMVQAMMRNFQPSLPQVPSYVAKTSSVEYKVPAYCGLTFKDVHGKIIELEEQGVSVYRRRGIFSKFENYIPYKKIKNIAVKRPSIIGGVGVLVIQTTSRHLNLSNSRPMSVAEANALADDPFCISFNSMKQVQHIYDALIRATNR